LNLVPELAVRKVEITGSPPIKLKAVRIVEESAGASRAVIAQSERSLKAESRDQSV